MTTRRCLTFKERMKIVEYLKQNKTSIEESHLSVEKIGRAVQEILELKFTPPTRTIKDLCEYAGMDMKPLIHARSKSQLLRIGLKVVVNELIDLKNILDVPVSEDLLSLKRTLSDSNGS